VELAGGLGHGVTGPGNIGRMGSGLAAGVVGASGPRVSTPGASGMTT
jgi:hypothetical protein